MDWQLQEAKSKFSELVRRTFEEGPQTITRHGRDVVVMVSGEEYRRLVGEKPDFKEFLMSAPEGLEVIDTCGDLSVHRVRLHYRDPRGRDPPSTSMCILEAVRAS